MWEEYNYDIYQVANILGLQLHRDHGASRDYNCPFCYHSNQKKGKLNLNVRKNAFRCNYCNEDGYMHKLYMLCTNKSSISASKLELDDIFNNPNSKYRSEKPEVYKKTDLNQLEKETDIADISNRHKVYSLLLDELSLSEHHYLHLKSEKRMLSDESIIKNMYRSVPLFGYNKLMEKILSKEYNLLGVPGFYRKKDGNWAVNFNPKLSGILIPVRDIEGHICSLQILLDDKEIGHYKWFTSSGRRDGTAVKVSPHFIGNPKDEKILITEGPIKADITHQLTGMSVIALCGASTYKTLPKILNELESPKNKTYMLAFDMDRFTNNKVKKNVSEAVNILKSYNLNLCELIWDIEPNEAIEGKNNDLNGIDDYLINKHIKQNAAVNKRNENSSCLPFKTA